MKLVTIQMTLGFENMDDEIDFNDKESIADYLSNVLYQDPDFFGNFGQENIIEVKEIDD
jgi:hypothetical protein